MITRVRGIVVGVDGSYDNQPAIDWAVEEALATHRPLALVAMLDRHWPARSGAEAPRPDCEPTWRTLSELRDRYPELILHPEVRIDDAVPGLIDFAADESMIIVGGSRPGMVDRVVHRSISMAVAGWSVVPTVVVPPDWDCHPHRQQPIMIGRDPDLPSEAVLAFAFAESHRRRVDLTVLDVLEALEPTGTDLRPRRCACRLPAARRELGLLQSRYPDVRSSILHVHGDPGDQLLRHSGSTQLLVLGRDHTGPLGLGIGSTARSVLRHSSCPVAVVPRDPVTSRGCGP